MESLFDASIANNEMGQRDESYIWPVGQMQANRGNTVGANSSSRANTGTALTSRSSQAGQVKWQDYLWNLKLLKLIWDTIGKHTELELPPTLL